MINDDNEKKYFSRYEIAQLILIVITIAVSSCITFKSIDYQLNTQTNFDKHVAAKQFYIEITQLQEPLGSYFGYYSQCRDLDFNGTILDTSNGKPHGPENSLVIKNDFQRETYGKTIRIENDTIYNIFVIDKNNDVIPSIIIYNGTALVTSPISIEQPIYIDENKNYDWDYYSKVVAEWNKMENNKNSKVVNLTGIVEYPIIPCPLYNDHGMYYVYQKDIYNFDEPLASDLYRFYYYLQRAESNREHLQRCFDSKNGSLTISQNEFDSYMEMRMNIICCYSYIPSILRELKEEENS